MSKYRARQVAAGVAANCAVVAQLHAELFPTTVFPWPHMGHWWVVESEGTPVAFSHLVQSTYFPETGYFARVGVLPGHRGFGLQHRLMKLAELQGRRNGWVQLVSDTRRVPHSAANFERSGWLKFTPEHPWYTHTDVIYWRKDLT